MLRVLPPLLAKLSLLLSVGSVLACAPEPDPIAPATCENCEAQSQDNHICVLDIENQSQDQEQVVCVAANSTPNVECNAACADWSASHSDACVGYTVAGTFACEETPPGTGGPGGGWTPTDYVDYDSRNGRYIVDQDLVDALNHDASILNNDATYLEELPSGGFEFNNITVDSLAHALGFQNGDIPLTVMATMSPAWTGSSMHWPRCARPRR
jgi:hypothetical protein